MAYLGASYCGLQQPWPPTTVGGFGHLTTLAVAHVAAAAAAAAATAAVDDEVKGVGGGAGAVEKGIRGRRAVRERAQNVGFGSESGTVSRSVARGGKRA